tara:strand:+ start:410 stop:1453 length:1044 start_codon:yes stop_codon:yes gene_type:complete
MNLNKLFQNYCKKNNLEINPKQLDLIEELNLFYNQNFNKTLLKKIFTKQKHKTGFYLQGDVGVGKTMILNFFYNNFDKTKQRFHFNEFMINFHDFVFNNKKNEEENNIDKFVKKLKSKSTLIYFDEFQVTNIVDAMILGILFRKIFDKNIKVLFSSNTKINDLYKDGLQQDQFIPFIKVMKNKCYEKELIIPEDYRKSNKNKNERYFYPLNDTTNFKINKIFRQLSKGRIRLEKNLIIKSRKFSIKNFYEGIARFDFNDLCNKNIGAEDYIKITEVCEHILIENIPNFGENNSNLQQRFITLIDIIYEKKIDLTISSVSSINKLTSATSLLGAFQRTLSRLHQLTSH